MTPNSNARSSRVSGSATATPMTTPMPGQLQAVAEHQRHDVAARRAERQRTPNSRVRWLVVEAHHAVDAGRREQQRGEREAAEQEQAETATVSVCETQLVERGGMEDRLHEDRSPRSAP